jgi:dipeptidyl aminopeptidase/acylaminoacyl peptidase
VVVENHSPLNSSVSQTPGGTTLDLLALKMNPLATVEEEDEAGLRWISDQRLLMVLNKKRYGWGPSSSRGELAAINIDGSALKRLSVVDGIPHQGPVKSDAHELHVLRSESGGLIGLRRLNTLTNGFEHVETPAWADQWMFDQRGQLRAVRTHKQGQEAVHVRDTQSGEWRKLREVDRYQDNRVWLLNELEDGQWLVAAASDRDHLTLNTLDPATGRVSAKPLLAVEAYDTLPAGAALRDGKLLGVHLRTDALATHWWDEAMKAHQAVVDQALPRTTNRLLPPERGPSPWILVRAYADVEPMRTYVFNSATRKLIALGGDLPDIDPSAMARTEMVRYKARDGLEIPAYLTLPRHRPAKQPLPLVVWVHDGPWIRGTDWDWQPEVQFLASRGYAVLQPEFRGSTGFGRKHFQAGSKQWGLAMQDDLADGARWAIAQGVADPSRVAVLGLYQYGGYAALMALVRDGDLFRCSVSWAGLNDLVPMLERPWAAQADAWKDRALPQLIGSPKEDKAALEAASPLLQAERIRRPVLVGHGESDYVVRIRDGRRMADALEKHNPGAEWVEYRGQGHSLWRSKSSLDWWSRVERFLEKHIAPATGPGPASQ